MFIEVLLFNAALILVFGLTTYLGLLMAHQYMKETYSFDEAIEKELK